MSAISLPIKTFYQLAQNVNHFNIHSWYWLLPTANFTTTYLSMWGRSSVLDQWTPLLLLKNHWQGKAAVIMDSFLSFFVHIPCSQGGSLENYALEGFFPTLCVMEDYSFWWFWEDSSLKVLIYGRVLLIMFPCWTFSFGESWEDSFEVVLLLFRTTHPFVSSPSLRVLLICVVNLFVVHCEDSFHIIRMSHPTICLLFLFLIWVCREDSSLYHLSSFFYWGFSFVLGVLFLLII